jgi:translation initiation factor 1
MAKKEKSTAKAPQVLAHNPFTKLAGLRAELPSTEPPPPPPEPEKAAAPKAPPKPVRPRGKVVVRRERKGHGGKTVTVVEGVHETLRESICDEMKRALGCGGKVEGGALLLQGEIDERAAEWLSKKGFGPVVRGS